MGRLREKCARVSGDSEEESPKVIVVGQFQIYYSRQSPAATVI